MDNQSPNWQPSPYAAPSRRQTAPDCNGFTPPISGPKPNDRPSTPRGKNRRQSQALASVAAGIKANRSTVALVERRLAEIIQESGKHEQP